MNNYEMYKQQKYETKLHNDPNNIIYQQKVNKYNKLIGGTRGTCHMRDILAASWDYLPSYVDRYIKQYNYRLESDIYTSDIIKYYQPTPLKTRCLSTVINLLTIFPLLSDSFTKTPIVVSDFVENFSEVSDGYNLDSGEFFYVKRNYEPFEKNSILSESEQLTFINKIKYKNLGFFTQQPGVFKRTCAPIGNNTYELLDNIDLIRNGGLEFMKIFTNIKTFVIKNNNIGVIVPISIGYIDHIFIIGCEKLENDNIQWILYSSWLNLKTLTAKVITNCQLKAISALSTKSSQTKDIDVYKKQLKDIFGISYQNDYIPRIHTKYNTVFPLLYSTKKENCYARLFDIMRYNFNDKWVKPDYLLITHSPCDVHGHIKNQVLIIQTYIYDNFQNSFTYYYEILQPCGIVYRIRGLNITNIISILEKLKLYIESIQIYYTDHPNEYKKLLDHLHKFYYHLDDYKNQLTNLSKSQYPIVSDNLKILIHKTMDYHYMVDLLEDNLTTSANVFIKFRDLLKSKCIGMSDNIGSGLSNLYNAVSTDNNKHASHANDNQPASPANDDQGGEWKTVYH
jgi:hypothetical protein